MLIDDIHFILKIIFITQNSVYLPVTPVLVSLMAVSSGLSVSSFGIDSLVAALVKKLTVNFSNDNNTLYCTVSK